MRLRLARRPATIDRHYMARYVRGSVRAQKDDDVCDLLWLAPTAERNDGQHGRFGAGSGRLYLIGQACVDEARRHRVTRTARTVRDGKRQVASFMGLGSGARGVAGELHLQGGEHGLGAGDRADLDRHPDEVEPAG